jgi:hypothetical protein
MHAADRDGHYNIKLRIELLTLHVIKHLHAADCNRFLTPHKNCYIWHNMEYRSQYL